ncbi:hypothetical protein DPMN_148215 [Dreissena polymorpha]|uniref:Uncharacterized protein n=1 Tax=Dreissena polymorpha TaxID=45954 RepID=A0A9D4J445_DREPO|nr:hypothetical protein DPMN_148215 [Dreissena polymorpha]
MTCASHESCYADAFENPNGDIVFNLGCRDRQLCGSSGKREVVNRSNGNTQLCAQCCFGNLCNAALCGQTGLPSVGPVCFKCDQANTPSSCNTIALCGRDDVCHVEKTTSSLTHASLYKSGCLHKTLCQGTTCRYSVVTLTCVIMEMAVALPVAHRRLEQWRQHIAHSQHNKAFAPLILVSMVAVSQHQLTTFVSVNKIGRAKISINTKAHAPEARVSMADVLKAAPTTLVNVRMVGKGRTVIKKSTTAQEILVCMVPVRMALQAMCVSALSVGKERIVIKKSTTAQEILVCMVPVRMALPTMCVSALSVGKERIVIKIKTR